MCGVTALFQREARPAENLLEPMTDLVSHRGPDGVGYCFLRSAETGSVRVGPADAWNIALGHRRLSILDLSDAGSQPMSRGPLWITYNGEIYNYVELRRDLEGLGKKFVSNTDTEVLLAGYEEWGLGCFEKLRGMWGFVLVDGRNASAVLCRDRLGIKPLYVAEVEGLIAVVSEQKQLREFRGLPLKASEAAVGAYLQNGFEDSLSTFFSGVLPIRAGTFQVLDLHAGTLGKPVSYWNPERVEATIDDPQEAAEAFRPVFEESVRITLRSDVPVGFALSGGLDSSSIAVVVNALNGDPSHKRYSFTATFPGFPFDERSYVETVASRISSTTHFTTPTPEGFLEDIDRFLWFHDEPVGSLSQYSAFCVARITREAAVPVTLNGQGGDEVLSGYWQTYFAGLAYLFREFKWGALLGLTLPALGRGGNPAFIGQIPRMAARALERLRPSRMLPLKRPVDGQVGTPMRRFREMSFLEWRVFEIRDFTLPRLLKWDDRNFMAFSVEGRYPFLDHRVVECCLRFKPQALSKSGWTKEPLRRALSHLLPPEVERRKSKFAFEAPQDAWLRDGSVATAVNTFLSKESPVWKFVEPSVLRGLQRRIETREANQALFRAFILDRWCRVFGVAG